MIEQHIDLIEAHDGLVMFCGFLFFGITDFVIGLVVGIILMILLV